VLPEAQARELTAHIVSCAECRATADKLRALDTLTAQAEEIPTPDRYFETFGSRVASRIAARKAAPERSSFRLPLWGLVPLATAAGLVLVIALRMEPPAPRLAIQLPPATRTGTAVTAGTGAPAAQTSPAPAVTAMPASQRSEQKEGSPGSGEPALAPNSSAPATLSADQNLAERLEEAAPDAAFASKAKAAAPSARKDEQKAGTSLADEPSLAASAAASAETERAKKMTSSSPVAPVAPVAPAGAIARMERDAARPPVRVNPAKNLQSRPSGSAPVAPAVPVRVIVIHLPDGGSYCPAPDIAPAIEITLPPAVSVN
jgi:hypothetical protein